MEETRADKGSSYGLEETIMGIEFNGRGKEAVREANGRVVGVERK